MGRGRRAGWLGGGAAIAVAVLACRQLVGIGDDPPHGPAGPTNDAGAEGGFTYGQGYYENEVPNAAATATDAQGFAAFVNVPAWTPLTLTVTPKALADASSSVPLFVRDGGMAVVSAIPTPVP